MATRRILAGCSAFALSTSFIVAQIGSLDSTFGISGVASADQVGIQGITSILRTGPWIAKPNGGFVSVIAAHRSLGGHLSEDAWFVHHLDANGSPDSSFGIGGLKLVEDIPYSSNDRKGQHYDFDQSGRLVIGVGKRVARLLPSGEPDPAFATGGLLELWLLLGSSANHVTFIKPISSGNILVGGLSTTLTEAGNLDKTHENPGVSDTTLQAIETYDGQVMTLNSTTSGPSVVGATGDANISTTFPGAIQIAYDGIPRYHGSRDGGLVSVNLLDGVEVVTGTDIGFSAGGGTVHGQSNIFRLPSGRFVAVANLSGQVTTLLLEPDGSLDTHLGGTGSMPVPQGDSIGLQTAIFYPNGSYVMGSANNLIKVQGELDTDGDQIPDRDESKSGTYSTALDPGTDPLNPDTDGDGLNDGQEVYRHGSNPHKTDSDHDGINDAYEVQTGFSPIDPLSHPAAGMNIYSAVELEVITKIGTVYRIQASMDNENWTDTNLVIEGTGGAIREIFRQTTSSRAMFWRAREE